MYQFITISDTTWTVKDGRLTRTPSPYRPPEVDSLRGEVIENHSFLWVVRPSVGGIARFRLRGRPGIYDTGLITRIDTSESSIEDAWKEFYDTPTWAEYYEAPGSDVVIANT